MIPGLSTEQAQVFEAVIAEQGLTTALHAVAELARAASGRLSAAGVPAARRWAAYADRIDELAYGLVEPDGRWETPLWHLSCTEAEGGRR